FALLTVLVTRGRLEIQDVARSLANLALWPLIALKYIYRALVHSAAAEHRNDFRAFRDRLGGALSDGISWQRRRELIFEFERFDALSRELEALTTSLATPRPKILNAFRHPAPTIAAKCHVRRTILLLTHSRKQSSDALRE